MDATFRTLGLCAGVPGNAQVAGRLRTSIAGLPSWDDLAQGAEDHGLESLLSAHLHDAGIVPPVHISHRLLARRMQHAHAHAVRTRAISDVLRAMDDEGVPVLALKGFALAHMAYRDPLWRPMRDVDLLVRAEDTACAFGLLRNCGFSPHGAPPPADYHHGQAVSTTIDDATVTVELHHRLLRPTPFVRAVGYDDVCHRAVSFQWAGMGVRTLGREDMLWHVYAHAFVINVLWPGIRLISLADLVHLTEAWVDVLDWVRVRQCYGRAFRALPLLHHVTPWSPGVLARLEGDVGRVPKGVRAIASPAGPSGLLNRDVWWPPDWWFRLRYGIQGPAAWVWCRLVDHPIRVAVEAFQTARRRRTERRRVKRRHGAVGERTVAGT